MLTRLLAAFLLVLLAATAAAADHRQAPYESVVRWAGCTADLVTSDQYSAIESFYLTDHTLYIGTGANTTAGLPAAPAAFELMILLHEIAHCLQQQERSPLEGAARELDADLRAADLACAMGLDGRRLLHDLFVWAFETLDYVGDEGHGTLAERISQGEAAPACLARPQA